MIRILYIKSKKLRDNEFRNDFTEAVSKREWSSELEVELFLKEWRLNGMIISLNVFLTTINGGLLTGNAGFEDFYFELKFKK